jgi:hypothetical protein
VQSQASQNPGATFRWGFASSGATVLALLVVGQVVGGLWAAWPPLRALLHRLGAFSGAGPWKPGDGGVLGAMLPRDWLFGAFLLSAAAVLWLNRQGILRFLRAMQTGVSLIAIAILAVLAGVLVPQIENFEDPEQRVTAANHAEELEKFRWAEGYFLYHLTHLYGIGLPGGELPAQASEGLERFGRVYGAEEQKNRRVLMEASLGGEQKTREIGQFIERHRGALDRAFLVCTALELNRTYKSAWFATLMALLAAGLLANTFRYPWRVLLSVEKAGYFVTHVGMLTLLTGGLVSNLFTDRGILELRLGEPPQDTYYRHYRLDKLMRMPFAVGLEHFARKEWKAIDVAFLQEGFRTRPPRYTVWPGRRIPLDWQPAAEGGQGGPPLPRLELVVREVHDHARVARASFREGDGSDGAGPFAVVQFDAPKVPGRRARAAGDADSTGTEAPGAPTEKRGPLVMAPDFSREPWSDPAGRFRLAVAQGISPSSVFPTDGDLSFGTLDVDVLGAGLEAPVSLRVKVGDLCQLSGGWRLAVRGATRDFQTGRDSLDGGPGDPRPLQEQPDGFRAVWVDVIPPGDGESERRLVSEDVDPLEYGLQSGFKHKDVVVRLRWDRWSEPGAPRFVFTWDDRRGGMLTSQDGAAAPVALGQELDLPGDTRVVLTDLFLRARPDVELEFPAGQLDPDGFDPSFYAAGARGLVLDVVHFPGTPEERVETLRMASIPDSPVDLWKSPDGRLGIRFLENLEGFPADWRSVLTIHERDGDGGFKVVDRGTKKQREIRVNDYFRHRGYRFFQTNADPKDPTYSGIGVVYDPGIEIVLAGMYTIILGTVLAFLVRPVARARRKADSAAGAHP